MENSNNEQYVYLLVVRTLGLDKTTLTYDVTPFKTIYTANNAVLYYIADMAKRNNGAISYISYTPHDDIDKSEYRHISFGRITFKSGVEVKYQVLLRKINEIK